MKILHHIIKDSEIIGIGPLLVQAITHDIELHYNSRVYSFDVHTPHRSITIKSEIFRPNAPDSAEGKAKVIEEINAWKGAYYQARKDIAQLIGEVLPEEEAA